MHALAAVSGLIVLALALPHKTQNPLHRPLALLAANQFAWNAASFGGALTSHSAYAVLGQLAAPFFTPLAFDFVVTFVGKRQPMRLALRSAYGLALAQLSLAIVSWLAPQLLTSWRVELLSALLLASGLPFAAMSIRLVVRHGARTASPVERLRARLLLIAVLVVTACLVTDPLAEIGLPLPRLATVGSFFFNMSLTHLTLGLRLIETRTSRRLALAEAIIIALLIATATLALFHLLNARQGALLVALLALSLTVAVSAWLYWSHSNAVRGGLERFANLGRFSAQMAHDLKNPLAAAKGAAEYLQEELRRSGLDSTREFASLLVEQLNRLQTVIERYQRLSDLHPQKMPTDINQLVRSITSLQRFATESNVNIQLRLADPAPTWSVDRDLLASALENVVKNALEAMPSGGTLTVTTEVPTDVDEPHIRLCVADTGMGLNARAKEQAFELFFTTKTTGSGLGLAFVRQVARAHGGDAHLSSHEGRGTTVCLELR